MVDSCNAVRNWPQLKVTPMWITEEQTPFDRSPTDSPLLRIAVHTAGLRDKLIAGDQDVESLLRLAQFPFVELVCTATEDPIVAELLDTVGVGRVQYELDGNSVIVSAGFLGQFKESAAVLQQSSNGGSRVAGLDDLIARDRRIDLFVTSAENAYLRRDNKARSYVDPHDALDLARILLVNLGIYEVTPGHRVGEWLAYTYRYKKLFSEYQRAWSAAVFARGQGDSEIATQLGSMSHRMGFICRAADKVSFFALNSPTNSSEASGLYHLGYLVMLVTGLFDDLAWTLNFFYDLGFNAEVFQDRKEVGIRVPAKGKVPKLLAELAKVNVDLYAFLTSAETQNLIQLFYPVRDRLQHRVFIAGLHLISSFSGIVYRFPEETVSRILNASPVDRGRRWGVVNGPPDNYIDPHLFALTATREVAKLTNGVLRRVCWEDLLSDATVEQKEAFEESVRNYRAGLGRFLRFGTDPIYL